MMYTTDSPDTLADALMSALLDRAPNGSLWIHTEDLHPLRKHLAAALIASGAVRPAADVRAEAWGEGYRSAMTASIGMQGRPNQGASFPADWPDHNPDRAALAEEGGDRG